MGHWILYYLASHILRQTAGNNDHILCDGSHLFDAQVHHPSKGDVLWLEEFRHGEKCLGCLHAANMLSLKLKSKTYWNTLQAPNL